MHYFSFVFKVIYIKCSEFRAIGVCMSEIDKLFILFIKHSKTNNWTQITYLRTFSFLIDLFKWFRYALKTILSLQILSFLHFKLAFYPFCCLTDICNETLDRNPIEYYKQTIPYFLTIKIQFLTNNLNLQEFVFWHILKEL